MTSLTIKQALKEGQRCLPEPTGYLESQLLLGKVLNKNRSWLIAHDDEQLDASRYRVFKQEIDKRNSGHPIAYLLGSQEFWSLELHVSDATLIPRADTEALVEEVIAKHPSGPATVVDLGTGSGAIALAVASEFRSDHVIAIDRCQAAIKTAKLNQQRLELHNVSFCVASWARSLSEQSIDILVSNPPYIAGDDPHLEALQYEPRSALVADNNGLGDIESIVWDAQRYLKPGGVIILEHGYQQQPAVIDILRSAGFEQVTGKTDLAGKPRFVSAICPESAT